MQAKIIKIISKNYRVLTSDGEKLDAMVMGKVRLQYPPVVGDEVEMIQSDDRWAITKIYPRKNFMIRPASANIDQALIVMSVKDPDFSTALIDRLTFLIANEGIEPLLCVTKIDLGLDEKTEREIEEYESGPMRVIRMGKGFDTTILESVLKDKITVLTGQSGAGKSSLINQLDPEFQLATQEISKALGRGKHTTRHNELHQVAGGLVADTPGFSSLDFANMNLNDLQNAVLEFRTYIGKCRFNDCLHMNEPNCAVKEAIEQGLIPKTRYENYKSVAETIMNRKEKYI